MNKYIFSGNLGGDAEVKYTKSGTAVCSFSVAVKAGYGDNERTEWIKCAIFGKRAESKLPQYLVKGQQVIVEGEPTAEAWIDKQSGEAKSALSVFVKDLDLVGKANAPQGGQQAPQQQNNQQNNQQQQNQGAQAGGYADFDDDVGF